MLAVFLNLAVIERHHLPQAFLKQGLGVLLLLLVRVRSRCSCWLVLTGPACRIALWRLALPGRRSRSGRRLCRSLARRLAQNLTLFAYSRRGIRCRSLGLGSQGNAAAKHSSKRQ